MSCIFSYLLDFQSGFSYNYRVFKYLLALFQIRHVFSIIYWLRSYFFCYFSNGDVPRSPEPFGQAVPLFACRQPLATYCRQFDHCDRLSQVRSFVKRKIQKMRGGQDVGRGGRFAMKIPQRIGTAIEARQEHQPEGKPGFESPIGSQPVRSLTGADRPGVIRGSPGQHSSGRPL